MDAHKTAKARVLQSGVILREESRRGRLATWFISQFKNNHFTERGCGTEAGSYLRLIDSCITQPKAQGPRTCNESKEEDLCDDVGCGVLRHPELVHGQTFFLLRVPRSATDLKSRDNQQSPPGHPR